MEVEQKAKELVDVKEVEVEVDGGGMGRAIVPSGASTGAYVAAGAASWKR